jgi:hypothetical protein
MSLFLLRHHDDVSGFAHGSHLSISRIFRRIGATLRLLHRAIVSAKLRRLQNELMFRHDYSDMLPPEQDATKFPQRPLVLGDKWDF